ncbi:MBL fold metallo-hydrolase [Phycicoccus sp.]|uniref:MBL fold metallo-hydrolase n=1 Tax=Phycicoccus sp. TaxID=1902410 RepID=UPI002BF6DF50|nr:MBL fold metallo-hydrolase [Phycicoccus sp.]HMM95816.1 MBL fold metallo-hydrolase [Phycicoccus sp.]
MVEIIPLDTPSLGDRSYLAHDGETALVVDPQRDYDRVLQLAEDAGVRITHVLETHIHNDYVTGGLALAEEVGAAYHVNAEDPVAYDRVPTRSGDVIEVSPSMTLTAIATPGHTFTHLSYALSSHGEDLGVFTGGSLLFGSTGRPDLLGPEHTDALARAQYASAHRVAGAVADDAAVFPTHGFGSFCSATQSDATASTIGREKRENPVLTQGEEEWVRDLLDGLDVHPAYYAHMGPANLAGPDAPDLAAPEPVDTRALRTRIERGEWVVDLRTGTAFAAGHVPGTFNIGVEGQFSTYVGWLKPWGADLTLLGETAEQVARAQRELVRIGIDQLAGSATGQPADWTDGELGSFPVATFADLEQVRHHRPVTVVDVRRAREYEAGHIPDAVNIPVHEVLDRADEAPEGELWVHCAGGYRAMVAGSILAARGRRVVVVDDSFDRAGEVGLLG